MVAVRTWGVFSLRCWERQKRAAARARKVRASPLSCKQACEERRDWRWKITRILTSTTGKLLALLRAFPPNEPTKKRFVSEMVAWSGKVGEYPNGDPELHHVAGTLYAEGIQSLHDSYIPCGSIIISSPLQKASHTMRSAISLSVPKTLLSSLLKSSTNGTPRMNPTPPLSTQRERYFLTSSPATSAPQTRLISYSLPASAHLTNHSVYRRSAALLPTCASILRCLFSISLVSSC